MNTSKKDNTEEKILQAAKAIFIRKGMVGARMQEIANEAGINKALLHYYFRSKQKLFEAIFSDVFQQLFPKVLILIDAKKPIKEKILSFVENYLDVLLKNPYLPAFVIQEINRDPQYLDTIFKSMGFQPEVLFAMFKREMDAGNITPMNPRDLIVNILSLCLFPIAAAPLMQLVMFKNDNALYQQFLEERKNTVSQFVLNSILIQ